MQPQQCSISKLLLSVFLACLACIGLTMTVIGGQMRDFSRLQMVADQQTANVAPSPSSNIELRDGEFWAIEAGKNQLKARVEAAARKAAITADELSSHKKSSSNIVRAAMAYYPSSPGEQFRREMRAFFLSWLVVKNRQPHNFETDLLIASPTDNYSELQSLGCIRELRMNASQTSRCIILPHVALKERPVRKGDPPDPLLVYERYVDCMMCLAEYKGFEYDAILRSDLDTFLIPGFADWLPPSADKIAVGTGGYGSENANAHLNYVSQKLGLRNKQSLQGLGSSWYGHSRLMRSTARLTLEIMRWFETQEFSDFERCCNGILGWPHWHHAVMLLYGGHVALNHIGEHVVKSGSGFELDFGSTSERLVTEQALKHVHCWHTDNLFSKFQFGAGKYDGMDLTSKSNMKTVVDYVTVIAVSSRRLTAAEFAKMTKQPTNISEADWKRLKP